MRASLLAAAVAMVLFAPDARANCAEPVGYRISEDQPGRVKICLRNFAGRTCPDEGLLRQRVDGDEIVKITTCEGDCFVDACAPAGTFRYGLSRPFECNAASCGTFYFGEYTVATGAAFCAVTQSVEASVPWGGESEICGYGANEEHDSGCGTAGSVLGANAALLLIGAALWRWRAGRRLRA